MPNTTSEHLSTTIAPARIQANPNPQPVKDDCTELPAVWYKKLLLERSPYFGNVLNPGGILQFISIDIDQPN